MLTVCLEPFLALRVYARHDRLVVQADETAHRNRNISRTSDRHCMAFNDCGTTYADA